MSQHLPRHPETNHLIQISNRSKYEVVSSSGLFSNISLCDQNWTRHSAITDTIGVGTLKRLEI